MQATEAKVDLSFSRKELVLLFSLAFIIFSHVVDFMIMMPLGVFLMPAFDINAHQFGLLVSTYSLTGGIFGLLTALYINRFDRKKTLLFFYVGFCAGTLACALSKDYRALLWARTLTGAFGGVLGSMCFSIVADVIPPHKRSTAMGYMGSGFSFASILGVPFSLFLAEKFDWHAPFVFLGVLGVVLTALIYYSVPPLNEHTKGVEVQSPWSVVKFTFSSRKQNDGLLFISTVMFSQFIIVPFLSQYLVFNAGFPQKDLWLIYLFGGGFSIISGPLIGRLADLYGKRRVYTISALCAIPPMLALTSLGKTSVVIILFWFVLFFILSGGRMSPAMAMLSGIVTARHRGSYMSFSNAVQQLTGALASYIAGIIVFKNASGQFENFEYAGYIAVLFIFLSLWMVRKLIPAEGEF